ncbi:hypothetical protein [Teredinibacter purpureus]|uniref:hypothetical protein n=1 Tax=Teredinibacter purpureus TaxID=2731756 RepID=UPI0013C4DF87|nr:hypothetical protein [Teredinibacter purpureus]
MMSTVGFDWFHSDLNITGGVRIPLSIRFAINNDNLNTAEEEAAATLLDVGQPFDILTGAVVTMGEGEMNSAGEAFESTADNMVLKFEATPNDIVKLSGNITYASSETDQRAGYVDTRFDQYRL